MSQGKTEIAKGQIGEHVADTMRDAQKATALIHKMNGASYRAIAKEMGISHVFAREIVREALAEFAEENKASVERHRAIATIRLEKALLGIAGAVTKGHLGAHREWRLTTMEILRIQGGLVPERHEITGPGGKPLSIMALDPGTLSDEQLQGLIDQLSGGAVGGGAPQADAGGGAPPPSEGGTGTPTEG